MTTTSAGYELPDVVLVHSEINSAGVHAERICTSDELTDTLLYLAHRLQRAPAGTLRLAFAPDGLPTQTLLITIRTTLEKGSPATQ